jgi:hypothetical protein
MLSASRPSRFAPCETGLSAYQTGYQWTPEPAWALWQTATFLAPAGIRTPDHPTHSLVPTPTTLPTSRSYTTN